MRPLEISIAVLLAAFLLWPRPRPALIRVAPMIALVILPLHLFLEGYRWQMIPLYVLTVLLTGLTLLPNEPKPLASFLIFILLAVSTALPTLLPVPKIPTPSGPYKIGTAIYELTDTSRKELYSGKDEPRRFMIQVWYPAEVKPTDEKAPWMADADIYAPAISGFFNFPSFFLDHLALVDIPAYKNAQVANADKPFPVILFSHGWKGFNAQNTGQALEMASHGFVVVGVQHTYGAMVTAFPDGTVAPNNPNALPADDNAANYEDVARILVNQWAGDIAYVTDQLSAWNEADGDLFFQKLDMERIGVYGHSTGGGAAIEFCGRDLRCKAVLGMDPFMRPVSEKVIEGGVSQPAFFMFSQEWADRLGSKNNQLFDEFNPHVTQPLGVVKIEGTRHYDFSDLPLLSPIAPQLGLKGPLNGKRVTEIVNTYLLDFFEQTLNGQPSKLFTDASPFPEVQPK